MKTICIVAPDIHLGALLADERIKIAIDEAKEAGVNVVIGGDELSSEPPMEPRVTTFSPRLALELMRALEQAKASGAKVDLHEIAGRTIRPPAPELKDIAIKEQEDTCWREERQYNRQEWRERNRAFERQMRNRGRR